MQKKNSKSEFLILLSFLVVATLVLTNGFAGRILAQEEDTFRKIEPIADVLDKILKNHVYEPDTDKVVEGALEGMMRKLDPNSEYVSPERFEQLTEDTQGQFDGIGVSIKPDDDGRIIVFQPIAGSPAAKAGLLAGDCIVAIDNAPTEGMDVTQAAEKIRGRRGTVVHLTIERTLNGEAEILEFDVKRDKIALESISEARVLPQGIGYIRIHDFKKNTADDLANEIKELRDEGMRSLVLDLRWNPGGLLNAAKDVSELFLPRNTLVTYTKGRETDEVPADKMEFYTERAPILPENFPMVVLVNELSASASEIVTGALQFYSRAIVVGTKTYGKGSVQTLIALQRPPGSALRLTTALYYTPARVTIDRMGIKPDVEAPMERKEWAALWTQMYSYYEGEDPSLKNQQNHGAVTGNEVTEDTVEDVQLKRAVEILLEDPVFDNLIAKYHKDPHETQVAAAENGGPAPDETAQEDTYEVEAE